MPVFTSAHGPRIAEILAKEFPQQAAHVSEILRFLDAGIPVPFLAHYRKERTGGADEVRLREIAGRARELGSLLSRKDEVLAALEAKGVLTDDVRSRIHRARNRGVLEDYLFAHRDGVRSAEDAAAEERLGPLASALMSGEAKLSLADLCEPFLDEAVGIESTVDAAVAVLSRRIYEDAAVRGRTRDFYRSAGRLRSKVVEGADIQKKYETYHDFNQAASSVPTHRVLAVLRGARESILEASVEVNREKALAAVRRAWPYPEDHPWKRLLDRATEDAYERRLRPILEADLLRDLKERADQEAVKIFARNLEQLLLAAPAGDTVVLGVDPGVRRGCKISVVDAKGVHQRHASIYPFADPKKDEGQKKVEAAVKTLGDFCRQFSVKLIAVGSGPGCRDVERFLRETVKKDETVEAEVVLVNDAGVASFATSPVARKEFPKHDPRVRSATSIARRLQDPLAEMAKMDARSIGVGPYQREVDQGLLARTLNRVVESCAARVGVDLNLGGEHLIARVPGIGPKRAKAIAARIAEKGPFKNREELKEVEGFDEAAWSVAAPFLRITGGDNPLDGTRIHPEAYPVVDEMAEKLGVSPGDLIANERALASLDPSGFANDRFGEPTVEAVFNELRTGYHDPRGTFEPPAFRDDLNNLEDLSAGMVLEGVITNIASFGAFVDVGVDQEGLIHVSELSDEFVDDPGTVVSVGQRVKVRVLAVDQERRRLSLSRRTPGAKKPRSPRGGGAPRRGKPQEGGRGDRKPGGGRPPRGGGTGSGQRGDRPGGGRPDGGRPDGGRPDGGRPDGGRPDGGRSGGGRPGGGRPGGGRPGGGRPGGGRPGGGRPGGGKRDGGRRGGGKFGEGRGRGDDDRRRDSAPRKPMIHEQKAKREEQPKIDPDLPEEEKYRLKLERLRKKFEQGE